MKAEARTLALVIILALAAALVSQTPAAAQTLAVSATILSKNTCQFNNPASATLAFGNLNPLNPVNVTANTTFSIVCRGSAPIATFLIQDDDGLHETGLNANRMRHVTNPAAYLPYSLTLSPLSANVPKNTNQTITVTGTVNGSDYQLAPIGSYADTVIVSIQP